MLIFEQDFGRDHGIFDIEPREGPSHGALKLFKVSSPHFQICFAKQKQLMYRFPQL